MSDNSDSESESFDPMNARLKEYQYYKLQKEMKEKEEKKNQNTPSKSSGLEKNKSAENSKLIGVPNSNNNQQTHNQAFNYEQGQDHFPGQNQPHELAKSQKFLKDDKWEEMKEMKVADKINTLRFIEEDFEK